MFKKYCILFCAVPIIANASNSVSQSVIFKGFPGNTTYTFSKITHVENNSGGQVASTNSLTSNEGTIVADFPGDFPPINPIHFSKDKYNMTCDFGSRGECWAKFDTAIYYGDNKRCLFEVYLKVTDDPDRNADKTHSHTTTGDCTTSGGGSTTLWVVKPK